MLISNYTKTVTYIFIIQIINQCNKFFFRSAGDELREIKTKFLYKHDFMVMGQINLK